MNTTLNKTNRRARGMSLVELLISLTILAIMSVGASNLITAGIHTDRVLIDSNRQVSDMEFTIRRLIHNIRTGSGFVLTGSTTLSLTSQADPNNNGQTYTVTYTYDAIAKTLSESTTQYGATPTANVLAYNVTACVFTQVTTSPLVIGVDITIAGTSTAPATRRTFQILNRNS